MNCIGRGEMLRTDIRVARSFLGLDQIALNGKTIAELIAMKKTVMQMVRDRRTADAQRAAE